MKHIHFISISLLLFLFAGTVQSYGCTAAVISGKATADGRPLLWKHRDTDMLDNRLEHFKGAVYSFTGLVNSSGSIAPGASDSDREVWIGVNTAGFALMNTASYNLNDDDVPSSLMDREGILIYKALGICKDLSDFECFLDTLSRPIGVQATFGAIDAYGGAAIYEAGNFSYVKYDANDAGTAPDGYIVFTNFSFSGRSEDRLGYERYMTASSVFDETWNKGKGFTPDFIFDSLSRSYRNEFTGADYNRDYAEMKEHGFCSGIIPEQDFIPRRSTSASVVVQGVREGENPLHSVMWTVLGYPVCGTAIPVPVSESEILPGYMKSSCMSANSLMCDLALSIKYSHVFRFELSNGKNYMDISSVFPSGEEKCSLLSCSISSDRRIRELFLPLYRKYLSGNISREQFLISYLRMSPTFLKIYEEEFKNFIR